MRRLLVLSTLILFCAGCGAAAQQHEQLNLLTDIADPAYETVVRTCDVFRNAIVDREGTTAVEDDAAMTEVNTICDTIVESFEALRASQETARSYIDSGIDAAAATLIEEGLAAWVRLRALVPRLERLGRQHHLDAGADAGVDAGGVS